MTSTNKTPAGVIASAGAFLTGLQSIPWNCPTKPMLNEGIRFRFLYMKSAESRRGLSKHRQEWHRLFRCGPALAACGSLLQSAQCQNLQSRFGFKQSDVVSAIFSRDPLPILSGVPRVDQVARCRRQNQCDLRAVLVGVLVRGARPAVVEPELT